MKSSIIPLPSILASLLTTLHIAAQPLKARQSQFCTDLDQLLDPFVDTLIKAEDGTPGVAVLGTDVDDIMQEVGCPNGGPDDFCSTAKLLEGALSARDFALVLSIVERLESDAGC